MGKQYLWTRPPRCLRCQGSRVWGHGYVARFFDGLQGPLWLKRWRCPDCHTVITVRPDSHWRGFWATRLTILVSLMEKSLTGHWLKEASRQRQQYWWRGYQRQAHLQTGGFTAAELFRANLIVATHSFTHREILLLRYPVNRTFAVTTRAGTG